MQTRSMAILEAKHFVQTDQEMRLGEDYVRRSLAPAQGGEKLLVEQDGANFLRKASSSEVMKR